MTDDDVLRKALVLIADLLKEQNEYLGKVHARLVVLRKAVASLYEHPAEAEEALRKSEADAEKLVLSGSGFLESDAFHQLMKAGKKLDELDA